jgi:hypothetical protein
MLTNSKTILKTGLIVLALSFGACGSSSSGGGTAGKGGTAGADGGGTAGATATAGAGGGTAGATGTAGADGGGAGADGSAGSDGSADATADAGEAGALTPEQIHDALINAPVATGTTAIAITRAAPKTYSNGTCQ